MAAPVETRSTPIVVAGSTVGTFVVEEILQGTLNETWLIAFMSTMIGFAAYLALRTFPLRVLDRILGVLQGTQHNLAVQLAEAVA